MGEPLTNDSYHVRGRSTAVLSLDGMLGFEMFVLDWFAPPRPGNPST
jgi:hypothetical protein